jgi:PDZ domain-containing protein
LNTSDEIVLPPDDAPRAPRRKRRWFLGLLSVVLVGFVLSSILVKLDYYAFRPGSVRDTSMLIAVDGTETYDADGSISYTTVSLRRVTLVDLITGWLDDDIDIKSREEVLGPRDVDENRQVNLALMDTSKQVATQVALEELGYEVDVSVTGEIVLEVESGSPADGEIEPGDTIVAIDGETVDDPADLARMLDDNGPGDRVTVTIQPFDTTEEDEDVELTLVPKPDEPDQGMMGVRVQATGLEFDFPFDVQFDTGDVGGPSAGLAFTLGLIDLLTPGELTGGVRVAATGEIHSDGSVGPVGGTGQKAAAVRDDGGEVFLVPSDDYEDTLAHAGDVEVIEVATLDDALEALADLGGNALELPDLGAGDGEESGSPR